VAARQAVEGAGEQFLAGAAGALQEHRAVACRATCWQDVEQLPHRRAAADDVGKGILLLGLAAQFLDHPQVAEALDAADDAAPGIPERGGGDADGDAFSRGIDDVDDFVGHRALGGQGLPQGAGVLANAGAEHLAAALAERFLAGDAGDLLGGPIEGGDPPVEIDGEHPVGHRIEHLAIGGLVHGGSRPRLLQPTPQSRDGPGSTQRRCREFSAP
jgi:hypothetical protein